MDSATSCADRLFSTIISGSSPARFTALAESYSQFVPGNTGISTLGIATPTLGAARVMDGVDKVGTSAASSAVRLGYTDSKTPSFKASSSETVALSSAMRTTGSAVVTPMRTACAVSSVNSATTEPGSSVFQSIDIFSAAKPILLPKDMFITASESPFSTAHAARTLPFSASVCSASHAAFRLSVSAPENRYTGWPASLNSGDNTSPVFSGATAKDISVGGTSKSRNVPDMESLPPMAAAPSSNCASTVPSNAENGLPQRSGSLRSFSKNS